MLDLLEKKWSKKEAKGKLPSRREGMAGIVQDDKVILYGGKALASPFKLQTDIHVLSTDTWLWKKLFTI